MDKKEKENREKEDRIKEKIRKATEAWRKYYEKEEEDTEEEERSEQETMSTIQNTEVASNAVMGSWHGAPQKSTGQSDE